MFKNAQTRRAEEEEGYEPLNIACVFSPPAEGNKDVQQIQEDLPQEKEDNKQEPDKKKKALDAIIADYNAQYGTDHGIGEFDLYYQDVQQRIKNHEYVNEDYPRRERIDIVIVVDMLLTGFDSKYLKTLYVDKNLKHHGLIQAFSRTNRVLNDTKPYGSILDFRNQEDAVNEAIALFSGKELSRAKKIWLVDSVPEVMEEFEVALDNLKTFMESNGLDCVPSQVVGLKGDSSRAEFVNRFKEVQRLRTQLDQYTDLGDDNREKIELLMPEDELRGFRGAYLETAEHLKKQQERDSGAVGDEVQQLDFEFVLFASALIDYDYIMDLVSRYTGEQPGREKMTREQIVGLICSDSKFMDEREDLKAYVGSLEAGKKLSREDVSEGYQKFKDEEFGRAVAATAEKHGIEERALQNFVDVVINLMVFDHERLGDLVPSRGLGFRTRIQKEDALMKDLVPLLRKRAGGRNISGLSAYD